MRERKTAMGFDDWMKTVPATITQDPLWKVEAYRLALFAADLGWHDATKLMKDRRTLSLSDQIYRSLGSINQRQCLRGILARNRQRSGTFLRVCSWARARKPRLVLRWAACPGRQGGSAPSGSSFADHPPADHHGSSATRLCPPRRQSRISSA